MKRLIFIFVLVGLLVQPVFALGVDIPEVSGEGAAYMPKESGSFWNDLLQILKNALRTLKPEIAGFAKTCLSIISTVFLISLIRSIDQLGTKVPILIGSTVIGILVLNSANTMIDVGITTVNEMTDYGKLILPVMTATLAAQGRTGTSTALYTGTVIFSSVLTTLIARLLLPMLKLYLCCAIANSATQEGILKRMTAFCKWTYTWGLKIILYIFMGYMTISGVISGTVDATAAKAAKLTISGTVPVVGGILADASETILLSAGLMKNAAGTYGLLAFAAILIGPFIKIGVRYILVKITAAVSEVFGVSELSGLINDYSSGMGFLLGMIGSVCLMLMVSLVCFLKGST